MVFWYTVLNKTKKKVFYSVLEKQDREIETEKYVEVKPESEQLRMRTWRDGEKGTSQFGFPGFCGSRDPSSAWQPWGRTADPVWPCPEVRAPGRHRARVNPAQGLSPRLPTLDG